MPGNETVDKTARSHLPIVWVKENFTKSQTTPVKMEISGWPSGMNQYQLSGKFSVMIVIVHLSEALTAGNVKFEVTKDGSGTGIFLNMNNTDGTRKRKNLVPAELLFNQSEEIGVQWTTNSGHAPDGVIDGVVLIQVQEAD